MPGAAEIYFKNRPTLPMTNKFKKGVVASLVKARNIDVLELQKNIDKVAFEFINTTNAVHRRGYVNRELETDAEGNVRSYDSKGATTGINFFKSPEEIKGAATNRQELFVCDYSDHYDKWGWSNGWDGFVHSDLPKGSEIFVTASFLESSVLPVINFPYITNLKVLQRQYDEYNNRRN